MIPVVSYLGPAFVGIITGSVIVDQVFSTGGIGQHFVNGAINRDYSLILGVTILGSSDDRLQRHRGHSLHYLDPRIAVLRKPI